MIERSKKKSKSSNRKRADRVNQKRRLAMEGLEARQLLAVFTDLPTAPAPTNLQVYTQNRNIGTVPSFNYIESERINETGKNDNQFTADYIPLGTAPGKQATIDVTGAMPVGLGPSSSGFSADLDTFSFDLRGGDILDVATLGAAGDFTVRNSSGLIVFGSTDIADPDAKAPRQTFGNSTGTMVIPRDGRYSITVAPDNTLTNYTLGLRVYRPVTESLAVGDMPILYLDFNGDIVDGNLITNNAGLPVPGFVRIPSLAESLPVLGLQLGDTASANRIINDVVDNVVRIFEDITRTGSNGDYEQTSNPGDYGIRVLNSRDHAGQISFSDPRVTRMLIGGTGDDILNNGVYGFAENVDIGNFDLNQFAFFALDAFAASAAGALIAPSASQVDYLGHFLGSVVAHEAAHDFGMAHTSNINTIGTLSDAGGTLISINYFEGLGPDLIYGTMDDIEPIFQDDFYINNVPPPQVGPDFPFFGFNEITANLSHVLSTGTRGGNVSGLVFNDVNRNGSSSNEAGLAGVLVYADVNRNGSLDGGEPSAISGTDGRFTLSVGPGSVSVIAATPSGFVKTTPTTVNTNVAVGGNSSVNFGFYQTVANATGTAFIDGNGNGIPDAGEGYEGVYVYIDFDGDNRPDLGEPGTNTASDGTYSLNFPGPGTYTLRTDLDPGFERIYPAGGEHVVNFNGISLTDDYDFGFIPSQDFGDLPFLTTLAENGARHGILSGLTIGSTVDREADGQPTVGADGDDNNNLDDEDGVRLLSPLSPPRPGVEYKPGVFEVVVNNNTGSTAYLQGFIDYDGDGDFDSQFASNVAITSNPAPQIIELPVTIPAGIDPGTSYQRFRLSRTQNLPATGFAAAGEVEDYAFPIFSSSNVANDDLNIQVPRNSLSFPIRVLDNDFNTPQNPLSLAGVTNPPHGTAVPGVLVEVINGVQREVEVVFYTPDPGFIGRDSFQYSVADSSGNPIPGGTALVTIDVLFQSGTPIAVDDVFEIPQGSSNRALNVLDNDVPSINGGLTITSVSSGNNGGTLTIVGGGQSIRYTPRPGFDGTEQFTYTIQDAAGNVSGATGTINLLPGSRNDDLVEFSIELLSADVNRTPISNVPAGEPFYVRVSVEDLREIDGLDEGVFSAFLDLLYTDELVTPVLLPGSSTPDIVFGSIFSALQGGNIDVPGLIDEVGGVQNVLNLQPHDRDAQGDAIPDTLFTLKMLAGSPGVASFQVDPADLPISETVLLGDDSMNFPGSNVALTPNQLRLGFAELTILPSSSHYPSAIDDSYPDGNIVPGVSANLDVLANDDIQSGELVRQLAAVQSPTKGFLSLVTNGTPNDASDDYFTYRAFTTGATGLDRFIYAITTENADGITSVSTAEVTIALPGQRDNAEVDFDFQLVSGSGIPILPNVGVTVGERFGVQIYVEDLRSDPTAVFAAYMDLLYEGGITPSAPGPGDDEGYDFAVRFNRAYYRFDAGVGTAARPGIIDEFGTLSTGEVPPNPVLLATVYFDAVSPDPEAKVIGSPADLSPFQDTLLFDVNEPVDRALLRFETLSIRVNSATPLQNPLLAQDVNNDGAVSPIDALVIINQMSREAASGEGESAAAVGLASQYFTDVNGDNTTSAVDALQVINYLAKMSSSNANGEQIAVLSAPSSSSSSATSESADDVFAALGGDDAKKLVSSDAATPASAVQVSLTSVSGADDDDDDDVLSLLADDVSGLWG